LSDFINKVAFMTVKIKKVKPLGDRVIVRRSEAKTTKGGIILPDSAQQKPKQGEVVAVGPGKTDDKGKLHPNSLSVGNQVLFSSYAGTEFKADDESEYLILNEEDIIAVIN
jgi:chaperonin GroES